MCMVFETRCLSVQVPRKRWKGNLSPVFRKGKAEECGSYAAFRLSSVSGKTMRLLVRETTLRPMLGTGSMAFLSAESAFLAVLVLFCD